MSIGMIVLSESSNKTITIQSVHDASWNGTHYSNDFFYMSANSNQIMYIENTPNQLTYLDFLSLSNTIFEGVYGWIWIIVLLFIFYYLLNGVKNNVK